MEYDKMTDSDFDNYLIDIINKNYSVAPASIIQIPGIYEILSEHFNNEVLERWEADHPDEDEDEDGE